MVTNPASLSHYKKDSVIQARLIADMPKFGGVISNGKPLLESYQLAIDGDRHSRDYLSHHYFEGKNIVQDKNFSILLLEFERQNFVEVPEPRLFRLGVFYDDLKDYEAAYGVYSDFRLHNFPPSYYRISTMYKFGFGVEKNQNISIENLKKAAALGHIRARIDLAKHKFSSSFFLGKVIASLQLIILFVVAIFSLKRLQTPKEWY